MNRTFFLDLLEKTYCERSILIEYRILAYQNLNIPIKTNKKEVSLRGSLFNVYSSNFKTKSIKSPHELFETIHEI